MRSRRITIEGNRYLVFYTFDDESRPGARAAADDADAAPATGEAEQIVAHPQRISGGEQIATHTPLRAEDGQGV